jgi:MFS superfamily sulfate permease-like transporter
MRPYSWRTLKNDIPSSIVVFLVAVPLCLGIALASGAPFFSGLIAGIVGGIVIGSLSNSQTSVSGPAAGLTAVVLTGIGTLGNFETFLCAVFIAGALQLLLGFLRAGSIANYFPSSVIKGMLTGIGIIIILKQLPYAIGSLSQAHPGICLISLVALIILIAWDKPSLKKLRIIPGALVAVLAGVGLNAVFTTAIPSIALGQQHLVNVPMVNNAKQFLGLFTNPDFSRMLDNEVWLTAVTIAIVASVETLLCIDALDKMDPMRRLTDQNRELKAQGVGNMISGLIGGLPITSVIVRSSANIQAGAKSKASTIIHGTLLLLCTALIPGVLNLIPLGALAAILIYTGFKLAHISVFKSMYANGKYQFIPFIITVVGVVGTDLLTGVGLGLAASALTILYGNMKNSYYFHKEKHHEGEIIRISLSEEVSFLNKASIKLTLEHLPANSTVIIDAEKCRYIDFDVLEIIRDFKRIQAPEKNINCVLTGFKEKYGIDNTHTVTSEQPKKESFAHNLSVATVNEESKLATT